MANRVVYSGCRNRNCVWCECRAHKIIFGKIENRKLKQKPDGRPGGQAMGGASDVYARQSNSKIKINKFKWLFIYRVRASARATLALCDCYLTILLPVYWRCVRVCCFRWTNKYMYTVFSRHMVIGIAERNRIRAFPITIKPNDADSNHLR